MCIFIRNTPAYIDIITEAYEKLSEKLIPKIHFCIQKQVKLNKRV